MIDNKFCMSSFLAFRYIEKPDTHFSEKLKYKRPTLSASEDRILVRTAEDIDNAIKNQISEIRGKCSKVAILLSGGMDSAILASYLPNAEAYTFRFLKGAIQKEELQRAEYYARYYGLNIHYVDICWNTVTDNLEPIMMAKGGPVHSIEPQICQGAKQAAGDGVDLMIIGDGSDYIFGGMDRLLSKDWKFEEFMKRYIYVNPFDVLADPVDISYLFERYRRGDGIDFVGFMDIVATEESYGSYANAFDVAGLKYFDPYEKLKMAVPLDLNRIRSGESKYLIRELFHMRYPEIPVPEKLPMPRPVDEYFRNWEGPKRPEFRRNLDMSKFTGNQKWLIWCLEQFLDMMEKMA